MSFQHKIAWACTLVIVVNAAPITQAARAATSNPAADYPNRPIRYILPNGPGSNADIFTRILAQKLGELFGHPGVEEGVAGMIDAEVAALDHIAEELVPSPLIPFQRGMRRGNSGDGKHAEVLRLARDQSARLF